VRNFARFKSSRFKVGKIELRVREKGISTGTDSPLRGRAWLTLNIEPLNFKQPSGLFGVFVELFVTAGVVFEACKFPKERQIEITDGAVPLFGDRNGGGIVV
jgi:hypothetical protein